MIAKKNQRQFLHKKEAIKMKAHLIEEKNVGIEDADIDSLYFYNENLVFQRYIPDLHMGVVKYLFGNDSQCIIHLKNLIGIKKYYKGEIDVTEEQFDKLKLLAKMDEEKNELEKMVNKLLRNI